MKVSSCGAMREMDRRAAEELGISEEILMENAGKAAYEVLLREYGVAGLRYTIFCGAGNNGGDGLVVARQILSGGGIPRVFLLGDPERFRGAARLNLEICGKLAITVERLQTASGLEAVVQNSDGIVDALFGTGLDREPKGLYRETIEGINAASRPVLSLDIPSGIQGDTGAVLGTAIKADHTVAFGLPKIGNLLYPGAEFGGRLWVCHLSFPPSLYADETLLLETNEPLPLPPRERTAHKGSVGDVLFVAGSASYFGAPCFAALSLLKAGGGYARLAAPRSIIPSLATRGSEIVFVPQEETESGSLSLTNRNSLLALASHVDMVVAGPGLSLAEETQQLVRELAAAIEKPILVDGDGITALCGHREILRKRTAPTLLTPHLGEMARLTDRTAAGIEQSRIPLLQETAADLHACIVLKGAHSLIAGPEGRVYINLSGNPGMATAGAGDVLTGTVAAMAGLGLSPSQALRKGVYLHGLAGDLAAMDKGEDGIMAQDILDALPYALKADREGPAAMPAGRYRIPVLP